MTDIRIQTTGIVIMWILTSIEVIIDSFCFCSYELIKNLDFLGIIFVLYIRCICTKILQIISFWSGWILKSIFWCSRSFLGSFSWFSSFGFCSFRFFLNLSIFFYCLFSTRFFFLRFLGSILFIDSFLYSIIIGRWFNLFLNNRSRFIIKDEICTSDLSSLDRKSVV